jgi:hypothetical protein
MGPMLVRAVGESLWLDDRQLRPEETRASIDTYLELTGSTLQDLTFDSPGVKAQFEARYGPI